MTDPKTILITGASTGFGRLAAETLARSGHTVYATMRGVGAKNKPHADELTALAKAENLSLKVVELDVTDQAQIDAAVKTVVDDSGRIDVLVNNAGIFGLGVTESFSVDQARWMYETNVFGPLALSKAVLPHMRAQRAGLLIHISSGVGRITFPTMGIYASTKWALEAIGESIRYETAHLGIDSVLIEPGVFKTEIFGKGMEPSNPGVNEDYGDISAIPEQFGAGIDEYVSSDAYRGPEAVVEAIEKMIDTPHGDRPVRLAVGADIESVNDLNASSATYQKALLENFGMPAFASLA